MGVEIPGVYGSTMHHLAVVTYQWHTDAGHGSCLRCGGRMPCPALGNALTVLAAAGDTSDTYRSCMSQPDDTAIVHLPPSL